MMDFEIRIFQETEADAPEWEWEVRDPSNNDELLTFGTAFDKAAAKSRAERAATRLAQAETYTFTVTENA